MSNTLVILGPTAIGKTSLAIELAKNLKAEIISADSMQVYRGMDIGTGKPTLEERQGIPHHLIDIRNPDEAWTVSDFVEQTTQLTNEIENRAGTPIIVGGTGLYLWTLLEGFSFPIVAADKELRQKFEKLPAATLYAQLSTIDPEAAAKLHPNDKKRIVRALEVYELTGSPISQLQKKREEPRSLFAGSEPKLLGINAPREKLYQRIEQRVDQMIEHGLINEVKGLLAKGYSKNLPAFQALGYKEAISQLDGTWTKEEMVKELKKRTRNFARRQMTWFKRFKDVKWLELPVDTQAILDYINGI
ncbi:MAG: tRNA (adenosine(37)-N6)-dimethylallyltransferase MiaA [Candidatus Margulisbacteria bacterium]|nr:tRNA (adenosine(37)-N6)-dimethylallyltransferase MiaA [Candidatus Margulisiibacteriota bacterium]